jgi:hypothetical protein
VSVGIYWFDARIDFDRGDTNDVVCRFVILATTRENLLYDSANGVRRNVSQRMEFLNDEFQYVQSFKSFHARLLPQRIRRNDRYRTGRGH